MRSQRPDVSDEDLGIRAHKLRQAQAVQREIERIRHGLKQEWAALTDREIEELEWVLGELWAYVPRDEWEALHFGLLQMLDIRKILLLGRQLRKHERPSVEILDDIKELVSNKA